MPQILTPDEIISVFDQRALCRCVPTNPNCPLCRRGFCYKFAPAGYAMDSVIQDKIDVDESKMAAKLVFAAGTDRDRKGDLFEIGGIDTSNHNRPGCAVVYLDHGRTCSKPIAKCFDQQNNYTVVKDTKAQKAWAWTYFCQGLKDAEDVFRLICGGFIASGSIGYRPVKAMYLPPDPPRGLPAGLHLLATDLVEVTWTGMPVNPEATRSMLEGTFGKSLSEPIRQTLLPFAAIPKAWSPGFTPEKKQMEDPTGGALPKPEASAAPAGGNPVDEDAKSSEKYGCSYMRAFHGDLGDMLTHYDKLHAQNEEPKVRKHMKRALDGLHKIANETSALHKGLYKKSDPLEHDEYISKRKPLDEEEEVAEGEGEDVEETEEGDEIEQDESNEDAGGEERGVDEAEDDGGEGENKPKKKKPPFKKEKSLIVAETMEDISEEQAAALLADLAAMRAEINQARPAGTV